MTMRILRQSAWSDYQTPPLTTVVRDGDMVDTLEAIRVELDQDDRLFVTSEIMEVADGTPIKTATVIAVQAAIEKQQDERNMATLYFWCVMQFPMLTKGGAIIIPAPTPLTPEQVEVCLERLARREDYDAYSVMLTTEDGTTMSLRNGEVVR